MTIAERILTRESVAVAPPEIVVQRGLRTLEDLDAEGNIAGKTVFVRADLDVPVGDTDSMTESVRLRNAADATRKLLEMGARKIVLAGHMGRPNPEEPQDKDSTRQLVKPLEALVGEDVDFVGEMERSAVDEADSRVVLLENLRLNTGEKSKDSQEAQAFARRLASVADTFVGEAFAVSHRNEASVALVPQILPNAAGMHLEEEIRELSGLLENPNSPFVAVIGGAKLETKVPVIENLARVADTVLVGGKLVHEIREQGLELPGNVIVADLAEDGLDISYESARRFASIVKEAGTIVWNGPMGFVEEGHDRGSSAIVTGIILNIDGHVVIGGGDTVDYIQKLDIADGKINFASAGGGAMLEFLEGKKLPGVEALRQR